MNEAERKDVERQVRAKALSRVRAKVGFRWHVAVFALINMLLFALNMLFSPMVLWFVWPLAGWSIGLAFHAFAVFQGSGVTEDMIEAEVQREMQKRGLTR